MGTLGSPSRTEPPEMPVPGTAARKASCEAKKGGHTLSYFPPGQKGRYILEVSHISRSVQRKGWVLARFTGERDLASFSFRVLGGFLESLGLWSVQLLLMWYIEHVKLNVR